MAIDINKIVEEALAKTTDLEILDENTNTDIDTNSDTNTDVTADEMKIFEDLSAINNTALSTAFAAGLGALSLRHNLKNIKEAVKVTHPTSIEKKIGLGVSAGLSNNSTVFELFGKIGQKVATIGAAISAAAVATWAIKDPDGLQKAIDTIVEKTKESPEKVRTFVESMFAEEKNPDDIVDKIVKLSTQTGDTIATAIKNTSEAVGNTASKVWKSFVELTKKYKPSWIK